MPRLAVPFLATLWGCRITFMSEQAVVAYAPVVDMPGAAEPLVAAPVAEAAPAGPAPVTAAERISSIDLLRGFALLGILLMNILTFGLPMAAYFNPNVAGGNTGANLWAWILQYILFDGRMRGIFSMIFGVSAYLLITRAEERGYGHSIADIYYRRTMWLILFGVVHAYLIWWGDILYPYALLGLILYPLRKLRPRALFIAAGVQIVVLIGMQIGEGFQTRELRDKAAQADVAKARGEKLTEEQEEAQRKWKEAMKQMKPGPEELKKETDAYRGSYLAALKRRAQTVIRWHSMPFYFPGNGDMLALMFIGIALLKTGVLTAERSFRFYAWLAAAGYGIGLPINIFAAWKAVQQNFEPLLLNFTLSTYQVGRVSITLAHVAVLMMIYKSGALRWLTSRLAAVGQMAFSNYISHSVICSLIFYGYGLAMFGRLERYQLYGVVAGIWLFQLMVSPIWLRHFRFGPLEWAWRSLTYWKRQPMRIRAAQPVEAVAAAS